MANEDFYKVVRKNVELIWPRLDQTYRYNSASKKTEACAPTVQGAAWSTGFLLSEDEAKALVIECKAHYQACIGRNSKLPAFTKVFGSKRHTDKDGHPTGMIQFTAERKGVSNAGEPNKAPTVVDKSGAPLADLAIWGGSKAHIRVYAVPTTDPEGNGGIKLLLNAVQVIDPVYGGDNLEDDFGPFNDDPDFGPEEQPKAQTPAQAAAPAKTPEPAGADDYGFA